MAEAGTQLVLTAPINAAVVFAPGGADAIVEKIKAEIARAPKDISTLAGRAAIASFAYKIARSKTALDEAGKNLVAEAKQQIKTVDAERRKLWDAVEALQLEYRKPLTDWEEADKKRIAEHEAALAAIVDLTVFPCDVHMTTDQPSSEEINGRIVAIQRLPQREWQEYSKRAEETVFAALKTLSQRKDAALKREAEQAELERLRREQAEREQRERDERIAKEAAEKARLEAEAKAKRDADEAAERAAAEQRRVEAERKAAEERAAEEERKRLQAEAAAKAAAEKAEADRKAAAEKAERDKQAAVEAERKRQADAKAADEAEAKKREADKAHKARINNAAKDALIAAGLSAEAATTAVTAIALGKIPAIRISY